MSVARALGNILTSKTIVIVLDVMLCIDNIIPFICISLLADIRALSLSRYLSLSLRASGSLVLWLFSSRQIKALDYILYFNVGVWRRLVAMCQANAHKSIIHTFASFRFVLLCVALCNSLRHCRSCIHLGIHSTHFTICWTNTKTRALYIKVAIVSTESKLSR